LNLTSNNVTIGKAMYFTSDSLISSLYPSFCFEWPSNVEEKENTLMVEDASPFVFPISLFFLSTGYFGRSVFVSSSDGEDEIYCGLSVFPCQTITLESSHFDSSSPSPRESVIINGGETNKSLVLSNTEIHSNITPLPSIFPCNGPLSGSQLM
jgi:hypothetical protein